MVVLIRKRKRHEQTQQHKQHRKTGQKHKMSRENIEQT
jgi:hypothetical protein